MPMLMLQFQNLLRRFEKDEEGQGLVEYGLIIGLVAIALILGLEALSGGLNKVFTSITSTLNGVGG